jgi:bacillithiol system protein YtxJ
LYYLDLLEHRDISNKIANDTHITHQSPQLIVIKNKEAIYHESHGNIDVSDIKI